MQFSKLTLLAAASVVSAQFGDLSLPPDIQSYVAGLETNTADVAALVGLVTATPIANLIAGIQTASVDPTAIAVSLEQAASAAIAAEPSGIQQIQTSVLGVIQSLIATDGAVSEVASQITGSGAVSSALASASAQLTSASGSVASASGSAQTASAASTAAAASSAAAQKSSVSSALAANPTGMAMGAVMGAVAGLAIVL